ncbi:DUF6578 domain-containing protein [Pseudonocardia phyllosphaerae]|uniref:DUF6578 domain-containing protein n=1 Tax=Pseudonocardia phyllosphaerae TaxID=3390502 RepID=UPI00397D5AB5
MPHRITFSIADWEIGCCAPRPVIGEETSWPVMFQHLPDDRFAEEHRWTVEHIASGCPAGVEVRLSRPGVVAGWRRPAPLPQPGEHLLRGCLTGEMHFPPPGLSPVIGRVARLRVSSVEYELLGRALHPVAGTQRARDVTEYPEWFGVPEHEFTPPPPGSELQFVPALPGAGRHETGVLVDVDVPD